jgi:hypothetical protein
VTILGKPLGFLGDILLGVLIGFDYLFEFFVSYCIFEGFWSSIPLLPTFLALTVSFLFEKLQRYTRPAVGLHVYICALPLDRPHIYAGCLSVSSMPASRKYFFKNR